MRRSDVGLHRGPNGEIKSSRHIDLHHDDAIEMERTTRERKSNGADQRSPRRSEPAATDSTKPPSMAESSFRPSSPSTRGSATLPPPADEGSTSEATPLRRRTLTTPSGKDTPAPAASRIPASVSSKAASRTEATSPAGVPKMTDDPTEAATESHLSAKAAESIPENSARSHEDDLILANGIKRAEQDVATGRPGQEAPAPDKALPRESQTVSPPAPEGCDETFSAQASTADATSRRRPGATEASASMEKEQGKTTTLSSGEIMPERRNADTNAENDASSERSSSTADSAPRTGTPMISAQTPEEECAAQASSERRPESAL
jgi:hypothetical protein